MYVRHNLYIRITIIVQVLNENVGFHLDKVYGIKNIFYCLEVRIMEDLHRFYSYII